MQVLRHFTSASKWPHPLVTVFTKQNDVLRSLKSYTMTPLTDSKRDKVLQVVLKLKYITKYVWKKLVTLLLKLPQI